MKALIEKYKKRFEANGDDSARDTFEGELNYESGKLVYLFVLALFIWLPYIPWDYQLHQFPKLAVGLRIGVSVLAIVLIALKLKSPLKSRPDKLLSVLVATICFSAAIITATAGEQAEAYLGEFAKVFLLSAFVPFPLKTKTTLTVAVFTAFFMLAVLTNVSVPVVYSLFTTAILSLVLSLTLNSLRYRSWEQRQKLQRIIEEIQIQKTDFGEADNPHDEARKNHLQSAEIESGNVGVEITADLLRIFCRDARKTIVTLRETVESADLKLFTVTVHAMKSALASIGEAKASEKASELEIAGVDRDTEFIKANTPAFIGMLESITEAKSLTTDNTPAISDEDIQEDTAFLTEQLQIIKTACEDYDADTAYASLDRLKEIRWKSETFTRITEIRDMLYLESDFDKVVELIDKSPISIHP
jgi:HPt (histidine-containing phosphotransfer) domain-containing protein